MTLTEHTANEEAQDTCANRDAPGNCRRTVCRCQLAADMDAEVQDKADPAAESGDGWQWWAGFNDEWMTIGPRPTRESAIDEAVQDGSGEFLDESEDPPVWKNTIYVTEARQDPLRLADWIGLSWLLERAEEQLADSDRVACENDDGPWFEVTPEQDKDLQERIRRACDQWQADHALVFTTATFSHQRNSEHLVVSSLRDVAGEANNA